MKKFLLAVSSTALLIGCSSIKTYKRDKDIDDIRTLTRVQFIEYVNANSPKYLIDRICLNVFKEESLDKSINKLEAIACLSPLFEGLSVIPIMSPYSDIDNNSSLGSLAYYSSINNIIKASSPYKFGAVETLHGQDLIDALKRLQELKK